MQNWQIKKLGALCDFFTDGNWIESKDQSPEGIRLIQTGNIGKGFFKDRGEKARYIAETTFKELKCTEIYKGDILISRLPDPVGRACILPETGERMITAVDCSILRLKKQEIFPEFFNYYSQSNHYLNDIEQMTSGTTRKRISRKNLSLIKIPLPPLPEQKRLVARLDDLFEKLEKAKENAEKNLKNAKEFFDSYLENALRKSTNSWMEVKLGDAYDVRDGTHDSPKYQSEGFPLVTSKNLKRNGLDLSNVKYISEEDYLKINARSKVHKGDILFAMIGTIGNPIVVEIDPIFAIKNVALFKVPEDQDSHFLKYYLDSNIVMQKMMADAKGSTQRFVGLGYLRNFKILLPTLADQKKIVVDLNQILEETRKLEHVYQKKTEQFNELKQSILHQAFTGKL